MSEVVVKLTDRHIKVKGGEYVQDIVRCRECRHWTYGEDLCTLHDMGMMADDFCSYGWKTLVDEDCYCSWGEREGE